MGADRAAGERLTAEQIELMTDIMVAKLASVHVACRKGFRDEDPQRPYRDEIKLAITDTVVLMESDDPAATLESWASSV